MRALLSVYDKTGLPALAQGLVGLGWHLVSSGGTSRALAEAGIPHAEVEELTGAPEMLGGRVKTLHPKVHGGILADRDRADHLADLEAHGIDAIDLVVCNLYPFASQPSVEMIDVGGPTMVRAAAKNHAHVGVVVDPSEYGPVLDELRREGQLSAETRRRLARAAFAHTAAYDAALVSWFDEADGEFLPPTLHLALERSEQTLRYGENPHQEAARYRQVGRTSWWDEVTQLGGLALSYLNLYDAEAAWRLVHDLGDQPACAVVKHANPCGVAVASDPVTAYRLALEGDPKSAFGGIVALNRPLTDAVAQEMVAAPQADVVLAPAYEGDSVERLVAKRKATRILEAPPPDPERLHLRQIGGGYLVQEPHHFAAGRSDWRVVTKVAPTEEQWADAELAWRVGGHVRSNSIVLVSGGRAVGIGAG
ncbi:MAG: bifunctional phosphoribosylaminoimidazolecarboxamide formyltransferase/IMP cyclohydrolase, partial [Actinomycetota bacterium]|nr:bifunctional phosphoribosylaminoimidazolecarboxamide formyltransferase/IMP cyclohydrolase [Actinomycetota bacterium]